jgi:hypothetical protein
VIAIQKAWGKISSNGHAALVKEVMAIQGPAKSFYEKS